jgi:hypothetical protein
MLGDWSTTLYYTFSTIAQSLAGALGLLAAFAVIRLRQRRILFFDVLGRFKHASVVGRPTR